MNETRKSKVGSFFKSYLASKMCSTASQMIPSSFGVPINGVHFARRRLSISKNGGVVAVNGGFNDFKGNFFILIAIFSFFVENMIKLVPKRQSLKC